MKIIKHTGRWYVENDQGLHGRFKTKREASVLLKEMQEEAALTPEQKEIRELKAQLEEANETITKLEKEVDELTDVVSGLEEDVSNLEGKRNISDDEENAIELVDALKLAKERLSLGVLSEADNIRELNEQILGLAL